MAAPVENPVTGVWAGSLLVNVWQASSPLPSRLALAEFDEEDQWRR
jgi:hypothetical protein